MMKNLVKNFNNIENSNSNGSNNISSGNGSIDKINYNGFIYEKCNNNDYDFDFQNVNGNLNFVNNDVNKSNGNDLLMINSKSTSDTIINIDTASTIQEDQQQQLESILYTPDRVSGNVPANVPTPPTTATTPSNIDFNGVDSTLASPTDSVSIKGGALNKSMTKGSKALRMLGNNISPNASRFFGFSKTTSLTRAISSKRAPQKRLFFKNGNINISRCNIDKRRRRYLTDIFTTLIDIKWRYNVLVFAAGFFVSWTFFAILWYLISYIHGDLLPENLNKTLSMRVPCIQGVESFAGAMLFSIETQQTIGYGVRYTTEKCPEAIIVMMIQSSVGVMIQSFMVGVVFAKLSRPKKRSETLMFSKNAVINLRDGRLCLLCRVADMRKSHIVEAHVRMYLIKKKVTSEGEIIPLHMYDLNVGWDKGLDRLFLVWPLTVEHYIDENSPFWNLSASDLKNEHFELAVILEGVVESTGMTTQARTSYLPDEILWGNRFEKLITFQKEDGTYKIDYSRFNSTIPVDTPLCSAKDLKELQEQEKFYNIVNFSETKNLITNSSLRKRKPKNDDFKKREHSTPEIILTDCEPDSKRMSLSLQKTNNNNNTNASSAPVFDTITEASFYNPTQNEL